jgi:hypothetical protein
MLTYLTDVRDEQIVVVQVTWFDKSSSDAQGT